MCLSSYKPKKKEKEREKSHMTHDYKLQVLEKYIRIKWKMTMILS